MEIKTKEFVELKKKELRNKIVELKRNGIDPRLQVIQIGENSASNLYVNNKFKVGNEVGIDVNILKLPHTTTQQELEEILADTNIPTIVQCPVPQHIDLDKAIKHLDYKLDVDGFTVTQKGLLFNGNKALVPATALGCYELLKHLTDLEGKKVVIVNRSHLIGKPLAQLLTNANATVTLCHSKSDLSVMNEADIVVTGCGQRKIFNSNNVKNGAIIIDCSMQRIDGIVGVGDFDKEDIFENTDCLIASGIGHTGLLTTCYLMYNVVQSYKY